MFHCRFIKANSLPSLLRKIHRHGAATGATSQHIPRHEFEGPTGSRDKRKNDSLRQSSCSLIDIAFEFCDLHPWFENGRKPETNCEVYTPREGVINLFQACHRLRISLYDLSKIRLR